MVEVPSASCLPPQQYPAAIINNHDVLDRLRRLGMNGHLSPPPEFGPEDLVAGVDTHADTHTLAVLIAQGGVINTETFAGDGRGYDDPLAFLTQIGSVAAIGVEGTNSYGAGLTRALIGAGFDVKEVLRPTRQVRRLNGKSDPVD